MNDIKSVFIFVVTAVSLTVAPAHADQVFKSDGTDIKGLVVDEYDDRILLSTYKGEIFIMKNEIDDIFFDEPQYNFVYLGHRLLREGSFDGSYQLFRRALSIEEDFYPARNGLAMLADYRLKSKHSGQMAEIEYREQLPFVCAVVDDEFQVTTLKENAGEIIKVDDIIARIWGYPAKYMAPARFNELLRGAPETEVELSVRRAYRIPSFGSSLAQTGSKIGRVKKIIGKDKDPVKLQIKPEGLVVVGIKEGEWKFESIFRKNDRIVEISGNDTRYTPIKKIRELLRNPAGFVYIVIERDIRLKREGHG